MLFYRQLLGTECKSFPYVVQVDTVCSSRGATYRYSSDCKGKWNFQSASHKRCYLFAIASSTFGFKAFTEYLAKLLGE
jgi:hypothetical protein